MNRERLTILSTRIGGFLGLGLFLAFALEPAYVYGGLVGTITAHAMTGATVGADLVSRLIVGGGMVLGILAVGSIATVAGGVAGAAFDALVLAPLPRAAPRRAVSEVTDIEPDES
ncbi:hypothetical protein L6R52_07480 [Myxococcota bacterium]|nr:hypothetical protein [Myxococcota bacterium]